jgi:DNA-binding GntR family transcriptional regulator
MGNSKPRSRTTAKSRSRAASSAPLDEPLGSLNGDAWLDTEHERSSVDDVYSAILLKIIHLHAASGTVLTSTSLARELGVSRTPVVSALDRLAADGMLQKAMNRRAIVRKGAENWLLHIHELREMLEPKAAALAATRITPTALRALADLSVQAVPSDKPTWIGAARAFDYALHLTIADHCGNLPLRTTIYKCWSYKRISYDIGSDKRASLEVGYREHVSILQALERHDADTASAAMLFHLRSASYQTAERRVV